MKLKFLGTGGADWSGTAEGGFFRRCSSSIIDGVLLIDPNPQCLEALDTFGCDKSRIKYIINTHAHEDHFSSEVVSELEKNGAEFISLKIGETKAVGDYTVTALKGNHALAYTTHFLISDGKNELYYGLDGAWLMPDVFHMLVDRRVHTIVLDGTYGFDTYAGIFEHNNLGMIVEMAAVLKKTASQIFVSHLSKKYHSEHNAVSEAMEKHGVRVAYDGLEINI